MSAEYQGERSKRNQNLITVSGILEEVFVDKGNWMLVSICPHSDSGEYLPFRATGNFAGAIVGCSVEVDGYWTETRYGRSFKAVSVYFDITKEYSEDAIVAILSSSWFKGIGEKIARKIYKKFGPKTISIIQEHPERLVEIEGLGPKSRKVLQEGFQEHMEKIQLAKFLKPEVSDKQIEHLIEVYGSVDKVIKKIQKNPYSLIFEVEGIGFRKADKLALSCFDIQRNDPRRIDAAIICAIDNASGEGHCYIPIQEVSMKAIRFVDENGMPGFTEDEVIERYGALQKEKKIACVKDPDGVRVLYVRSTYEKEVFVAQWIADRAKESVYKFVVSDDDIRNGIAKTELQYAKEHSGYFFEFNDTQKKAVCESLSHRVSVITGGPGTGKTTCLRAILNSFMEKYSEDDILLCAPTGRAAARMRETTHLNAMTIHSAALKCNRSPLVIADETSMVDIHVMAMLIGLVANDGRLILIGDPDQLPSVGAGNVLNDIITSEVVPVTKLEVGYRNSGSIAHNAANINKGIGMSALEIDDDFDFEQAYDRDLRTKILAHYYQEVDKYGVEQTCLITPIRRPNTGFASAYDLNLIIRDTLNPGETLDKRGFPLQPTKKDGIVFRVGDRVMLTKNKNDPKYPRPLVNGDTGVVLLVTDTEVTIKFDDPVVEMELVTETDPVTGKTKASKKEVRKEVIIEFTRFTAEHDCILAYACTVHKSQGQEYKSVIVACGQEHYYMLERSLIYTAITRAKKHCVIVGDPKYVNYAAKTVKGKKRNTLLKARILKEFC